jgi:hypothetical protein
MDDEKVSQPTPRKAKRAVGGARVGRRAVMKAGAATVAGLALGTTYLKPGMISVGVQEAYALSDAVATPQTTSQAPTTAAPAALPATGEAAAASTLPGAVGLVGLSTIGLGYVVSRMKRRRQP